MIIRSIPSFMLAAVFLCSPSVVLAESDEHDNPDKNDKPLKPAAPAFPSSPDRPSFCFLKTVRIADLVLMRYFGPNCG